MKRNPTDRQKGKAGSGEFEIVSDHPLDPPFPFSIECKAHESFKYAQLFRQPLTGPLPEFWAQAVSQAEAASKRPLLILKRNNGPTLVAAQAKDIETLCEGIPDTTLWISQLGVYVITLETLLSSDPTNLQRSPR